MKDINGDKLSAGDEVFVFLQRYERQQEPGGVWVVDQSRPLAVADVPLARGVVEWDAFLMAWVVRYLWTCDAWRGKAGAQMGGGEYAFELVKEAA